MNTRPKQNRPRQSSPARSIIGWAVFLGVCAASAAAAEPVCVSGIYPHLAVFNSVGKTFPGECGIGAIVPWAGRLWMITYPPHATQGSTDKLYEIDEQLDVTVRPESVGGTHACRMIHRESKQLIIGPYFIDEQRTVRAADLKKLAGRMTAVARHLTDPANRVYFFDMEGAIYEVDVHTLDVTRLFEKPVPGWHGKGGYTSQGRLVIANNGEAAVGGKKFEFLAGELPKSPEDVGALAEWDGQEWRIVERRQFLDVTGPGGIHGAPDDKSPLWSIGWDKRSVILKLLDDGRWFTFRVPKASHAFDPKHGWYTEWPRIREIAPGKALMVIHGMMYDFPLGFCAANTAGLAPVCSHLRYVTDVCTWNGRLLVSSDDASIMRNPMVGQSQSNTWFGDYATLGTFGPRAGWGGPWLYDTVKADEPSVPFLVNGFARRCLHLAVGDPRTASDDAAESGIHRCTGAFPLTEMPPELAGLTRVTIARGDYHRPAPGYRFTVNQPVIVFLAVDDRPPAALGAGWEKTEWKTAWRSYTDNVFQKTFPAGPVEIPGHPAEHKPGDYGVPHLCFVKPVAEKAGRLEITGLPDGLGAKVSEPDPAVASPPTPGPAAAAGKAVTFTIEADARGAGKWAECMKVTVPDSGYLVHMFPVDFQAQWVRLKASRDCVATACFHLSAPWPHPAQTAPVFQVLADVKESSVVAGLIRPAGHNRNLQWVPVVAEQGRVKEAGYLEVNERLEFAATEPSRADELQEIAEVKTEFTVDAASVIMTQKGRRYRLPKGCPEFDQPLAAGRPRCIREVASERYLFNAHGTFYEMPRDDGLSQIKPVCSHSKQIMDYCTWRGLLVLSGTRKDAKPDGHLFAGPSGFGLWFGQVDDLWKLGKPVGTGGPWRDTPVQAGVPSDAYLMTNYDRKTIALSHAAGGDVTFTVELDFDHRRWHVYKTFTVPTGKTVPHAFPEGLGAHWVRVRTDRDCTATAWLVYE